MLKAAWNDYREVSFRLQISSISDDIEKRYQIMHQMYNDAMGTDIVHNTQCEWTKQHRVTKN